MLGIKFKVSKQLNKADNKAINFSFFRLLTLISRLKTVNQQNDKGQRDFHKKKTAKQICYLPELRYY